MTFSLCIFVERRREGGGEVREEGGRQIVVGDRGESGEHMCASAPSSVICYKDINPR